MSKRFSRFKRLFTRLTRRSKKLVDHSYDVALVRRLSGRRVPSLRQVLRIGRILGKKERHVFNVSLSLLLVSVVWLFIIFAFQNRAQVPKVGGEYVEGIVGTIQLINPLYAPLNDVDMDVSRLVYSGLMKKDKDGLLMPDLATSYEISEDKKTYTFTLRDDVKWHDGESFSAYDVAFTYESVQDSSVGSPLIVSFRGVQITVADEHTITFMLEEPFSQFASLLTLGILPEHIWGQIPADQMRLAQRNVRPIGSGPFKFKRLLKDETGFIYRYELERNEDYYDSAPFLETFVLQFYAQYDAIEGPVTAIREQKIDGLHFVPLHLRDRVKRKHIELKTLQLPQYTALFFNDKHNDILEKKSVREALSKAVDKQRILVETLDGEGTVLHGPILPGFPGYSEEFTGLTYAVDEANELLDKSFTRVDAGEYVGELKAELIKELMQEQGSTTSTEAEVSDEEQEEQIPEEIQNQVEELLKERVNDAQLFYRKDDDEIVEIELVTADTPEYHLVSQFLAGYWQELGIKTNITFIPSRELSRRILKGRNYDVLLYGVILGGDPDQYSFWHSSQVEHPGLNLSGYVNRKTDGILEKIRESTDEAEIDKLYVDLQTQLIADIPAVFLYTPNYTYAQNDSLKGFAVERISHPSDRFSQAHEWYVRTKRVWRTP